MFVVNHGKLAYALGIDDMFDPTDSQASHALQMGVFLITVSFSGSGGGGGHLTPVRARCFGLLFGSS